MLIRGKYRETAAPRGSQVDPSKKNSLLRPMNWQAAIKIQKSWRGRQGRLDFEKRRSRAKPWGYYTHTLALTYVSAMRNGRQSGVASPRSILFLLLEDPSSSQVAQAISIIIVSTIVVSIGCFVLETIPSVYYASPSLWLALEVVCSVIFTTEYFCRLAVCDQGGEEEVIFRHAVVRFLLTPMNFFDLMAVLPFYVEVILRSAGLRNSAGLRMFRLFRLIRMVRIFKLGRYASGMRLIGEALKNASQAISVLVFLLCMGVLLFSSALFHVERLSCPDRDDMSASDLQEYANECADDYHRGISPTYGLCCTDESAPEDFPSIVAASWWSMVTMTSVGYGEVVPRTTQGKCVGFVAMLVGMVLIALPVAIVGQKFQDVYESHDLEETTLRATARMKVSGEVWSLVPSSNIFERTKTLKFKDHALAGNVSELVSSLEKVWEQRERLSRERKLEMYRQDHAHKTTQDLVARMMSAINTSGHQMN